MRRQLNRRFGWGGAAVLCGAVTLGLTDAAKAEDFFSALFNAFGGGRPPVIRMPFANEGESGPYIRQSGPRLRHATGGQAFCVRTCDGRYFPITGSDEESRTAACNSFCPASQTRIVYGGNIDSATTDNGKPYSELPNAFRYRSEVVAGCTCNGKDQFGLAHVDIDHDPTLRKGDIVASTGGLMAVSQAPDKRGALNFSPLPASVSARYQHLPVVARE
ncbi:MAG TPA: DUF2865 domain-containing protein [Bradyrhizobium sp.]|nr:DUF2865 domain-containing protein [Bradyrhizobium sp.]